MGRLIDADSAIERVKAQGAEHPNAYPLTHYAELILSEAPTVDAEPARRGVWFGSGDGYADGELVYDMWECSNCGYDADGAEEKPEWHYCPNCGAKMDYVNENEN